MKLVISDDWSRAAARWAARRIKSAVRLRGLCALALSGGRTPRPFYEELARLDLPWARIRFYFADERAVSPGHPESNYRLIRKTLLCGRPECLPRTHRLPADAKDLDRAARRSARAFPAALDLLVLGMGADGHTASLFPGSPALGERRRRVVPARAPSAPRQRLTISPPVIASARAVLVLVSGKGKAAMLARALRGPREPAKIPAQLALRGAWFVDCAAAKNMRSHHH